MPDIRVNVVLPRHWKYKKLKRLLGVIPMEFMIILWGTIAEQIPNGELNGWTAADIEDAAGWDGEPGKFCQALIDSKLLDITDDGFYPHDWADHQPWVIGAPERSEAARKAGIASAEARKAKGQKPTDEQRPVDAPLNGKATDVQRKGNPRTPSPSPSPLKEESKKTPLEKPRGPSSPDHHYFASWWVFAFKRHTGSSFVFQKKHAGIISGLLKSLGLVELISRACVFLCIPDERRFPPGSPTLEGLLAGVNQFAGKCNPEIEEKCFRLGILPEEGVNLEDFKPWAPVKIHPLPMQPGLNPGHSP
jgi:hypothetical protein